MRPLVYVACLLLVAPVVVFTVLHDAIMAVIVSDTLGELLSAFWRGLSKRRPVVDAMPMWGMYMLMALVPVSLIAFVALAWSARHAWIGFGLIALVGLCLTVLAFVRDGAPPSLLITLLHVPAILGVSIAVWMLVHDPRVHALRSGWSQTSERSAKP